MLRSLSKFGKYAWIVLGYNTLVVLFGAFVRATGSGAGCGAHWPLCNGVVIPRPEQIETVIEFTHRATSGVTLILIAILVLWTWRIFPKRSLMRWSAGGAAFFTITEALVGAGIVLYGWVADDTSVARAISVPIHLVNTFLLLGMCAVTAWWASTGIPDRITTRGKVTAALIIGVIGMLFLGASGAITALGDTLFPAASLSEGVRQDFEPTAHFLVRMRIYHPGIAIAVGVYLAVLTAWVRRWVNVEYMETITTTLFVIYVLQIILGIINVALLAPIWMQITHLLVSCAVWVIYVIMATAVFSRPEAALLPNHATGSGNHQVHNRIDQTEEIG